MLQLPLKLAPILISRMNNFFKDLKSAWQDWQKVLSHLGTSIKALQSSLKELEATLSAVNAFQNEIQKKQAKLAFKNKAPLARIAEAKTRIETELAKYQRK